MVSPFWNVHNCSVLFTFCYVLRLLIRIKGVSELLAKPYPIYFANSKEGYNNLLVVFRSSSHNQSKVYKLRSVFKRPLFILLYYFN